VLTTINGRIFYASHSDAYSNKWNAIDDDSVGHAEKMKVVKFMRGLLKEVCKADIDADLKEIIVKKIRWGGVNEHQRLFRNQTLSKTKKEIS